MEIYFRIVVLFDRVKVYLALIQFLSINFWAKICQLSCSCLNIILSPWCDLREYIIWNYNLDLFLDPLFIAKDVSVKL